MFSLIENGRHLLPTLQTYIIYLVWKVLKYHSLIITCASSFHCDLFCVFFCVRGVTVHRGILLSHLLKTLDYSPFSAYRISVLQTHPTIHSLGLKYCKSFAIRGAHVFNAFFLFWLLQEPRKRPVSVQVGKGLSNRPASLCSLAT